MKNRTRIRYRIDIDDGCFDNMSSQSTKISFSRFRSTTAHGIAIVKAGYKTPFAHPADVQRAAEHAPRRIVSVNQVRRVLRRMHRKFNVLMQERVHVLLRD